MNLTREFEKHLKRLDDCKKSYQYFHAHWSTWNYWAQNQKEYDEWLNEQCLKFKDVKAASDRGVEIKKDMSEGASWFAGRSLAYREWELARQDFSDFLRTIWFERNGYNDFIYSLEDIANAWGRTIGSTIGALSRYSWYKSRSEIVGHHPSKGWHLRRAYGFKTKN